MSSLIELPIKCQGCSRGISETANPKCAFCLDIKLHEEILCDLNRCVQDPVDIKCFAYHPKLELITPSRRKKPVLSNNPTKTIDKLLNFDKTKYERALALQKLNRNPDDIFGNIKYHLMWNVVYRYPVFNSIDDSDFIHSIFLECSELAGGLVNLLYLAPDHVHIYVESDIEKSIEEIAQKIKQFSQKAILTKFPDIRDKLFGTDEIWDKAYFAQTVG